MCDTSRGRSISGCFFSLINMWALFSLALSPVQSQVIFCTNGQRSLIGTYGANVSSIKLKNKNLHTRNSLEIRLAKWHILSLPQRVKGSCVSCVLIIPCSSKTFVLYPYFKALRINHFDGLRPHLIRITKCNITWKRKMPWHKQQHIFYKMSHIGYCDVAVQLRLSTVYAHMFAHSSTIDSVCSKKLL